MNSTVLIWQTVLLIGDRSSSEHSLIQINYLVALFFLLDEFLTYLFLPFLVLLLILRFESFCEYDLPSLDFMHLIDLLQ